MAKSAGDKRSAKDSVSSSPNKKARTSKNQKLEVGEDGDVGLKKEEGEDEGDDKAESADADQTADEKADSCQDDHEEADGEARTRSGPGETKQEGDEIEAKTRGESPGADLDEPKHGKPFFALGRYGHLDDRNARVGAHLLPVSTQDRRRRRRLGRRYIKVSHRAGNNQGAALTGRFHILLIPKSAPHDKGHYHRTIEVGKKKLPDPGAKKQVIWGLVTAVSTDVKALKDSFGEYSYETKTKGTRHQPAARPAARGHYILHSPRDELADDPERNRQRDFKMLLAYEITTPAHEDFGNVQAELGIEEKGAVVLQVKDPDSKDNTFSNPRAANIPREKKAHYPPPLKGLFDNRRWIPANPPALLNYQGAEILILTSPHKLEDSLGKDGEKVEDDLDHDAEHEKVNLDGAMKELGMSKKETEVEALEGHWA